MNDRRMLPADELREKRVRRPRRWNARIVDVGCWVLAIVAAACIVVILVRSCTRDSSQTIKQPSRGIAKPGST